MYRYYAEHYDAGQLHFSLLMHDYLRELLGRHPVEGQRMLDLACGTGTLAIAMASEGWDVLGIDHSSDMLGVAQRKIRGFRGSGQVRFQRADIRAFRLDQPVQLATCFYDSLNYLLEEQELLAVFERVYASLAPQGLWIFDLNTPYFLEHVWSAVEVEEREGYLHVMQSHFDHKLTTSTLVLTGFVREKEELYTRFDETHVERGYQTERIQALLERAGLAVEASYDCFTTNPPYPESHRVIWIARKP